MAATLITRLGGVAQKFLKPLAVTALALSPDGSNRYNVTTAPTVSSGSGVPTEASPDGSVYFRIDASAGTDFVYARISGAWVALAG